MNVTEVLTEISVDVITILFNKGASTINDIMCEREFKNYSPMGYHISIRQMEINDIVLYSKRGKYFLSNMDRVNDCVKGMDSIQKRHVFKMMYIFSRKGVDIPYGEIRKAVLAL